MTVSASLSALLPSRPNGLIRASSLTSLPCVAPAFQETTLQTLRFLFHGGHPPDEHPFQLASVLRTSHPSETTLVSYSTPLGLPSHYLPNVLPARAVTHANPLFLLPFSPFPLCIITTSSLPNRLVVKRHSKSLDNPWLTSISLSLSFSDCQNDRPRHRLRKPLELGSPRAG